MIVVILVFSLATVALFVVGAYASNLIIKQLLQEDSLGTEEKSFLFSKEAQIVRESSVIHETHDVVIELQRMLEQVLVFQQQNYFPNNYIYALLEHSKGYSDNLPQKESLLSERAN